MDDEVKYQSCPWLLFTFLLFLPFLLSFSMFAILKKAFTRKFLLTVLTGSWRWWGYVTGPSDKKAAEKRGGKMFVNICRTVRVQCISRKANTGQDGSQDVWQLLIIAIIINWILLLLVEKWTFRWDWSKTKLKH